MTADVVQQARRGSEEMTVTQAIQDAAYQLRKILATEGAEFAKNQPWLWEFDRWKELVFSLLARITAIPQSEVRLLVEQMTDLDMLDIEALSAIGDASPAREHLTELMRGAGIEEDVIPTALTTLQEAAQSLRQSYDGKIQKYLRRYGETMLREVHAHFHFTVIKPEEVADAFTYWLQNVVDMPLSLRDDALRAFSDHYGFTTTDVVEGADLIDMNLALVDDLVQLHVLSEGESWRKGENNDHDEPATLSPVLETVSNHPGSGIG